MIQSTILNTLFLMLMFGGFVVCAAFFPYTYKLFRQNRHSPQFWLAVAIILSWGGLSINRAYILVSLESRHFGWEAGWLREHWLHPVAVLPVVAGMCLFIRVATYAHFGEYFWLVVISILAVVSYTLATVPQLLVPLH
jgi:hypothetical protein